MIRVSSDDSGHKHEENPSVEDDLLASFWTLAGDIDLRSDQASPWSFEERVAAAADAGFCGFGIEHREVAAPMVDYSLDWMRSVLTAYGMAIVELELLTNWYTEGEERVRSDQIRTDLLTAAEALGARHVKVGAGAIDTGITTECLIESFAVLCEEARRAGTGVVLEVLSFGNVRTLSRAVEIVVGSGASNAGILLDAWHVERSATPLAQIAELAQGVVGHVELAGTGPRETISLWKDTTSNRRLCGEGDLDLGEFVTAVRRAGYDGPYGVEILSKELWSRPLHEISQSTFDSAMAILGRCKSNECRDHPS